MRGLVAMLALVVFGCGGRDAYRCASSDHCVGNGAAGVCEASGFCSFEDPSCPGGRKYETNAGGGLGGTCVVFDAGIDGSVAPSCIGSVTHGRHFGCVLKTDGTVWCAGENGRGQIGFGLAGATLVTQWMQARERLTSMPITDATMLGAGGEHVCAVRAGGALWCWGAGDTGQLGDNGGVDRAAAVAVRKETDDMPLVGIVEVAGGLGHTCARDDAGAIWCFGRNDRNQIGDSTTIQRNRAVQVLTGAVSITTGRETSCARKVNDEIWCWGRNDDGQVGDGSTANKAVPTMVGTAKQVDVGTFVICRLNGGQVACSGSAWRSRLGTGAKNIDPDATTPVPVLTGPGAPPLANVVEIALGGASCARLADGAVKCWSDNMHGQSGTGASAGFAQPVKRADGSPLVDAEALWAHFSHLCARRKAGEVECWGRGLSGEFGDGKLEDRGAAAPLGFPCP